MRTHRASRCRSWLHERGSRGRAGARRILLTLEGLGYVECQGRQFRLTPKILDLGFAYLSSLPLWNLAEPVMEMLVDQLKQSCSGAVLDGDEIIYVLRMPTHKIMSINLGIAAGFPRSVPRRGGCCWHRFRPRTCTTASRAARCANTPRARSRDLPALEQVIAEARLQGWCLVNQELEEGLESLAAPIRDRSGRTIAAFDVSAQASRTPPETMLQHFLPRLREAADRISYLLGGRTGR